MALNLDAQMTTFLRAACVLDVIHTVQVLVAPTLTRRPDVEVA